MRRTETPYVILHHHSSGLVVPQRSRDYLFSSGNLLELIEWSLYSLQPEPLKPYTRRPLTVILWGVADRYEVAENLGVDVIAVPESEPGSNIHNLLEGRRLIRYTRWLDPESGPGYMSTVGHWLRPTDPRPWDREAAT